MGTYAFGDSEVHGASGGKALDDDRPLVMLVHGAAMDRTVWALQTRWLAYHGLSALAVDLPGHGSSPEPECSSIGDYADWLARHVEAAERPVHLVGHSMGSFVVLETASRAEVASLTLIGTAAAMPVHPTLVDAAERNDPLAAQLMSGWAFAHKSRTGPHPSPGSCMVGAAQALISQAGPGVLARDLVMCADYDRAVETAASLPSASRQVTFLLGKLDRMTPPGNAQTLIEAVGAGAVVTTVEGVGHMIQTESPTVARATIAETVARA